MRTTNPVRMTSPNAARRGSLFPLALLFSTALLAACTDAPDGPRDPAEDIPLTLVTEEVFTVGSFSGDEWDAFGSVRSVAFDARFNLHIFDAQADHIVVVGPDGSLLRTVGGPGEGPGEFNAVTQAIVERDGSYIIMGITTIDFFEPGGEFVERITRNPMTEGIVMGGLALPDGRVVTTQLVRLGSESEPVEGRPIYVVPLDGSEPETLYTGWKLPAGEDDLVSTEGSAGGMLMRFAAGRAFEPRLDYEVMSDGLVALIDSIGYRIKMIGPDGSVVGAVERPIAPLPVDEEIMERARETYTAATPGLIASGERANIPVQVEREGVEGLTFADEVPVIAAIRVDWEDRIWVERTGSMGDDDDGPIDIITPAEGYIGTLPPDGLRTPSAFGPDGLMAYIETDEMDVPMVRVVRLVAFEPAG